MIPRTWTHHEFDLLWNIDKMTMILMMMTIAMKAVIMKMVLHCLTTYRHGYSKHLENVKKKASRLYSDYVINFNDTRLSVSVTRQRMVFIFRRIGLMVVANRTLSFCFIATRPVHVYENLNFLNNLKLPARKTTSGTPAQIRKIRTTVRIWVFTDRLSTSQNREF